jgi:hypothetical protein
VRTLEAPTDPFSLRQLGLPRAAIFLATAIGTLRRLRLSGRLAWWLVALGLGSAVLRAQPAVLKAGALQRHVAYFNGMENEPVVSLVPNAEAATWLEANIPLFECSDPAVEQMYYFRWWAMRKQLRRTAEGQYVFTEFINRARPISSALGHHLYEGRWLRNEEYQNEYVLYWLRGLNGGPQKDLHNYSSWLADAVYARYLVNGDEKFLTGLLDDLVRDYEQWSTEKQLPTGLYWQFDVRDAMEESISGSRKKKNVRPTINSYMFGNARAIAAVAWLAGKNELATEYEQKAATLRKLTEDNLWDPEAKFFEVRLEDGPFSNAREEIGFIPWYFNLPEPGHGYEVAWAQLTDPDGFKAPFGITTAERRHPQFRSHGVGGCEWDGALWPFATSQTLGALANVLRHYPQQTVTKNDYYDAFLTYAKSFWFDGIPYVGEYQDEKTGYWLKGHNERSRWYNHSTFADLVIAGLIGIVPRADDTLELDPLLPAGKWPWFALDGVNYHGRSLTILWDADGNHYNHGKGLTILADGKPLTKSDYFQSLTVKLPSK